MTPIWSSEKAGSLCELSGYEHIAGKASDRGTPKDVARPNVGRASRWPYGGMDFSALVAASSAFISDASPLHSSAAFNFAMCASCAPYAF